MIGYVHGHHDSVLKSHRTRTAENSAGHLLPHLEAGMSLLDIGSGPGTITVDLARRVGRVTALETSEEILALTRAEADRSGVEIEGVVGDVHALELPDDSFDVVHAHQVLQHVHDPVTALREMKRVCRPGGLVSVREGDYHGFVIAPRTASYDTWLTLYDLAARERGGEPDAGRFLLGWAHRAGFTQVTSLSSTWCWSTPEARQWWGDMWAERITDSALAQQLLDGGHATRADLDEIAAGWQSWAADPDGWMSVLHGVILARA
ncbi:MAG: class I SAM-dependent methyltransferase [Propionibacteriales bacterium]|nr:class I SAM-dependent methyltransferase [Propionibacteriales bacterium]